MRRIRLKLPGKAADLATLLDLIQAYEGLYQHLQLVFERVLWRCRMDGVVSDDGAAVLIANARIVLPAPRPDLAGKPVSAGFRPEHLTTVDAGQGLNLVLDLVEHLGADSLLHGHLEGKEKHLITMRVEGHFTDKPDGLVVGLKSSSNLHVFDKASGLRL